MVAYFRRGHFPYCLQDVRHEVPAAVPAIPGVLDGAVGGVLGGADVIHRRTRHARRHVPAVLPGARLGGVQQVRGGCRFAFALKSAL